MTGTPLSWLVKLTEPLRIGLAGRSRRALVLPAVALAALLFLTACGAVPGAPTGPVFRLIAGSGFSSYEPLLKRFAAENGVNLEITYKGSLDIMRVLQDGSISYDAIWDADSLWTTMGDDHKLIRDSKSITCSPVVFGVKQSIAQALGWVGKPNVPMQDILTAIEARKLRTMMTSATQSNSGASAYFGFLSAFAGNPETLTAQNLRDPVLREKVTRILGTINRTSESSGWLRDLFIAHPDDYDAMFNYESHILLADQELAKTGHEPLYVIYPAEGLGIADFPLSFVSKNNADQEPVFLKLQQFLLSGAGQQEIASKGRRIGPLCNQMDPAIAKAEWGVDPARTVNKLRLPVTDVIMEALKAYQTTLRKPSFTIYCLDFSGSMRGTGEQQLKAAMHLLLDQQESEKYLLQASPDDVTMVLVFDSSIMNEPFDKWTVSGNDPAQLGRLFTQINNQETGGGTDIYQPAERALELMRARGIGDRIPSIILMTDGKSNSGSLNDVKLAIAKTGLTNVPVNAITFGDADPKQLQALADLTIGRVFDGTKDLITAFRNAKGNN